MKNIGTKIIMASSIFLVSASFIVNAEGVAPGALPGSIDDPVVTKSYIDSQLQKLVADEMKKVQVSPSTVSTPTSPATTNTGSGLTIVQIQPTQTLYGGSGTEFIVRTGKVQVTSSDESGIADVTSGKDIIAGQVVELNHLLIVPREGRGIKPDPKNKQEIFVMVRGGYSILNADGTMATP